MAERKRGRFSLLRSTITEPLEQDELFKSLLFIKTILGRLRKVPFELKSEKKKKKKTNGKLEAPLPSVKTETQMQNHLP